MPWWLVVVVVIVVCTERRRNCNKARSINGRTGNGFDWWYWRCCCTTKNYCVRPATTLADDTQSPAATTTTTKNKDAPLTSVARRTFGFRKRRAVRPTRRRALCKLKATRTGAKSNRAGVAQRRSRSRRWRRRSRRCRRCKNVYSGIVAKQLHDWAGRDIVPADAILRTGACAHQIPLPTNYRR